MSFRISIEELFRTTLVSLRTQIVTNWVVVVCFHLRQVMMNQQLKSRFIPDQLWRTATVVYGHYWLIMVQGDCNIRSLRINKVIKYRTLIIDSHMQYCQTIFLQIFLNIHLSLSISGLLHRHLVNHWRILKLSSLKLMLINHRRLLHCLRSPVVMCSSTSLCQCIILLHSAQISKNKMLGYVFRRLDRIVSGCVAGPAYDELKVLALSHTTHIAVEIIFLQHVRQLFCRSISFSCV